MEQSVLENYQNATDICISVRRFNSLKYRFFWIPGSVGKGSGFIADLFSSLGLTAEQLGTIFHNELKHTCDYSGLGFLTNSREDFRKLADLLQKNVHVYREDGMTGDHYPLFVACPNGSERYRAWKEFLLECADYARRVRKYTPYPRPQVRIFGRSLVVPLTWSRLEQARIYFPRAVRDLIHGLR